MTWLDMAYIIFCVSALLFVGWISLQLSFKGMLFKRNLYDYTIGKTPLRYKFERPKIAYYHRAISERDRNYNQLKQRFTKVEVSGDSKNGYAWDDIYEWCKANTEYRYTFPEVDFNIDDDRNVIMDCVVYFESETDAARFALMRS